MDLAAVAGQHWLKAAVLYLPTHEGGQGLIDLESRVAAFRLKAAQQLLYHSDLCSKKSAHALLRKAGRMGLGRHLFLLNTDELDLSGLGDFYATALKAWKLLKAKGYRLENSTALGPGTGINSQRLLEQFLSEVRKSLSKRVQELLELPRRDAAPEFPSLRVTAADGGWKENRGTLLNFSESMAIRGRRWKGAVRSVSEGEEPEGLGRGKRALLA
ncbi:hypothetical protein AOLI_G00137380 [Acnodon oligacanthus]